MIELLQAQRVIGPKMHSSGPDLFGLSDIRVARAIQELPGASECTRYRVPLWDEEEDAPTPPAGSVAAGEEQDEEGAPP